MTLAQIIKQIELCKYIIEVEDESESNVLIQSVHKI